MTYSKTPLQEGCVEILTDAAGKWLCALELKAPLYEREITMFPEEDSIEEALDTLFCNTPVCRRKLPGCPWEYMMPEDAA